jgi:threonine synthase
MRFLSTRSRNVVATLSAAIADGIAPDGGLYVPERLPIVSPDDFSNGEELQSIARDLLRPFTSGDPLDQHLEAICRQAFSFDAPLVQLHGGGQASVLELFHEVRRAPSKISAHDSLQRV